MSGCLALAYTPFVTGLLVVFLIECQWITVK